MIEYKLTEKYALEAGYGFQTRKQAQQALAYCRADSKRRSVKGIWYKIARRHDILKDPDREWGVLMIQIPPNNPIGRRTWAHRIDCGFVWFECCLRRDMKLRPA